MRLALLKCAKLLGKICAPRGRVPVSPGVRPVLLVLLIGALSAPTIAKAQSLCRSCEVQLGLGGTYHFWGPTGGLVLAATMNWDASRYELGVIRVASAQVLRDHAYRDGHRMADPYWGVSLSRRWRLFQTGPVQGFGGLGLALKSESDQLSATRWDFAEQLGLRFWIPGQIAVGELTVRHWSNAGIRLPNHGQDFVTLTFRVNSGRFGIDKANQIPLDPAFQSRTVLLAKSFEAEGSLP
jgi:Lipid A 3-O-deacylase (PagL)